MTREELDARAEELNISTRSNWKDETVAEKIAEAEAALAAKATGEDTAPATGEDTAPATGEDTAPAGLAMIGPEPVMITITGPKRGRWRAGRHFTPAPVQIPLADLSDDEIEMLRDDPKLSVAGLPGD